MRTTVDVDQTRRDIRDAFRKWDIDPSEFEILWEEDLSRGQRVRRPGAIVRYLRNGQWQTVACYGFSTRAANLRQCFLLLDRLRIAERNGMQYEGLTYTTEMVVANKEQIGREGLLEAYDILGVGPDDPIDLVRDVYRKKAIYFHPDRGGSDEKFKRLQRAYETVCQSRGVKP